MNKEIIESLEELLNKSIRTSTLLAEYEYILVKYPDYPADQSIDDIDSMRRVKSPC